MTRFRNFKPSSAFVRPKPIYVSQIVETPQSDGTVSVSQKMVDASSFALPSPSDYQLKDLVASGVPITTVSPTILDSAPTFEQIQSVVDSIVKPQND